MCVCAVFRCDGCFFCNPLTDSVLLHFNLMKLYFALIKILGRNLRFIKHWQNMLFSWSFNEIGIFSAIIWRNVVFSRSDVQIRVFQSKSLTKFAIFCDVLPKFAYYSQYFEINLSFIRDLLSKFYSWILRFIRDPFNKISVFPLFFATKLKGVFF